VAEQSDDIVVFTRAVTTAPDGNRYQSRDRKRMQCHDPVVAFLVTGGTPDLTTFTGRDVSRRGVIFPGISFLDVTNSDVSID